MLYSVWERNYLKFIVILLFVCGLLFCFFYFVFVVFGLDWFVFVFVVGLIGSDDFLLICWDVWRYVLVSIIREFDFLIFC